MRSKGLIWGEWYTWLIFALVLVLGLIAFAVLSGKGSAAIDFINNLLRFGR